MDGGVGIAHVIWAVQVGGFDLMVLTETNITNQAYCRNRLGYDVVCSPDITTDDGTVQGGVVLVVRYRPNGLSIKSTRFHGPKVASCKIIAGGKRTPLIGAYLSHSILEHLLDLEEALT